MLSPIGDWQAIAFTLLACRPGAHGATDEWAEELAKRCFFAYNLHGRYPKTSHSYWDLVDHPSERSDECRRSSTEGSILYPMLAIWAAGRGKQELFDELTKSKEASLDHCTFQSWLPDEDSKDNLYLGLDNHGAALTRIPVTANIQDTLEFVLHEATNNPHYDALSAVRLATGPSFSRPADVTRCRCRSSPGVIPCRPFVRQPRRRFLL